MYLEKTAFLFFWEAEHTCDWNAARMLTLWINDSRLNENVS